MSKKQWYERFPQEVEDVVPPVPAHLLAAQAESDAASLVMSIAVMSRAAGWPGRLRDGEDWDREREAWERLNAKTFSNRLRQPVDQLCASLLVAPEVDAREVERRAAVFDADSWRTGTESWLRSRLQSLTAMHVAGDLRKTQAQLVRRWGHHLDRVYGAYLRGVESLESKKPSR